MGREPFGMVGFMLAGLWLVVSLLVTANPQRFFLVLGLGRVALPSKLVGPFRVLGIGNAVGLIYLIIHFAFHFP